MLGQGVYILSEVAKLTGLHPNRVRSWFKPTGQSQSKPIFRSDYPPINHDFAVSFYDLIDVLVVGELRNQGVNMSVVRRTHALLTKELGVKHPFCHSDIYTDGKRVFVYTSDELRDECLSEVISHQLFFTQIRNRLSHIEYSEINHLAAKWNISKGVVVDPVICMGKPSIVKTGISTFVLAKQFYANNCNAGLVSDLYGVSETQVTNAVTFEECLGRQHAA